MKSWKTTLGGALLGLSPIVKNALAPSQHWIADAMLALGGIILGGSARDNNVTSEQVGADKPKVVAQQQPTSTGSNT